MKFHLFPERERGRKDLGWLKSNFIFSFSDYYNPANAAFGTLVALNDDFVQQGKGFAIHPHQNTEIISLMLRGTMNHKDKLGHETTVTEGSVQILRII